VNRFAVSWCITTLVSRETTLIHGRDQREQPTLGCVSKILGG